MAEGPTAHLLYAVPGAPMPETIPPVSKSQPAAPRDADPHGSVTIAPQAPDLEDLLRQPAQVPAESEGDELRTALDAGARASSTLSQLSRMAAELSSGVVRARRANERLVAELSELRTLLAASAEQQIALQERTQELTQELARAREDAERERRVVTSQHDEFVAALIEEHEDALTGRASPVSTRRDADRSSELAQELVRAESARQRAEADAERAREALASAQRECDEAKALADTRQRERDELRAEASQLRARLGMLRAASTAPPPALSPRPPTFRPPAALRLDSGELDATLHAGPALARPTIPSRRRTPPPVEPEQAVEPSAPTEVADEEAVREFPCVSTRPGVGGPKLTAPPAVDFGPPPSGWTPPPPPPAEAVTVTPPRPRVVSAATLPAVPTPSPLLKQKPDHSTRPLINYSIGEHGVKSETLEGARISSKPPRSR